jgi:hypothetical protein
MVSMIAATCAAFIGILARASSLVRSMSELHNLNGYNANCLTSLMADAVSMTDKVATDFAALADGIVVRCAEALRLEVALFTAGERRYDLMRHWARKHALKKRFGIVCDLLFGRHLGLLWCW